MFIKTVYVLLTIFSLGLSTVLLAGTDDPVKDNNDLTPSLDKLHQIQCSIREKGAKWTARMPSRIPELMPIPEFRVQDPEAVRSSCKMDTPEAFDWRDYEGQNWVRPVRDQGRMGSCWAFGACACIEAALKIRAGNSELPVDLSESYLVNCSDAGSEEGGWHRYAAEYIEANGIVDEQCAPYVDYPVDCSLRCRDWQTRLTYIDSYRWVFSYAMEPLREAILEGPLAASFMVYEDFFYYESGVYEHTWGEASGGHVILICGYDNNDSCWIAKNSWGTDWGENGYFKIKWRNCFIEVDLMSVEVSDYPPYGFPELLHPSNSAVINHNPINFNWEEVADATNYQFELATDLLFNNILYADSGFTSSDYYFDETLDFGFYYWHSRGCNSHGCGSWSSNNVFMFTNTGIGENEIPSNIDIDCQAFPNPFNGMVRISLKLPPKTPLEVDIHSIWGDKLFTLFQGFASDGETQILWEPVNLGSGIYFYRVSIPHNSYLGKVFYLK
ncbi:hypothetical protein JW877_07530 [bacterium]|nr:hypothetical protein [bacterium]